MKTVNLTKPNVDLFKYKSVQNVVNNTFTYTLKAGKLFSVQSV